ncbi:MAG: phosphoglucosamine mutase [Thermoanaerobaculia bacterium]
MKLFGTDGLRATAGAFPLDPESLRLLGRELGRRLPRGSDRCVVLGGDTRESTAGMIGELAQGLTEGGCRPAHAGTVPTPAVAELVLALGAGAGISVSASHNPYEDNGVKIFGPDGRKLPDSEEEALEAALLAAQGAAESTRGLAPPPPVDPRLAERYLERLAPHASGSMAGLPIVLDAGHGAAFRLGPEALRRAGARVHLLHAEPDGRNINRDCGALHPEGMAAETKTRGAALGVALDGDADRSIFSDEQGRILDGDDVLWILARDWKRRGRLAEGGVVGTVMSNYGLESALAREGIAFHRAAVGDRNVARKMEETGAVLGGETSGHILQPFSPSGDGILTTLLLASVVVENGGSLSALATLQKSPQALRNVRAARRVPIDGDSAIGAAAERAAARLSSRGRVFLRYSGTEPLLRILVEGPEAAEVRAIADDLERTAREAMA